MAFDVGPRHEPLPPSSGFQRTPLTWSDVLDAVLRTLVFVPLALLYLYWVWTILQQGFDALF